MSHSSCKTLEDKIARARERELDIEMERKRKPEGVQSGSSEKKPKVSDHIPRSQQIRGRCGNVESCMRGRTRQGVQAASSAAELGI